MAEGATPMRLAFIGNFGVSYSTESHLRESLLALGHDVVSLQENELDWSRLALIAQGERVDFVQWVHTHGFAPESTHEAQTDALRSLRELGIPTVAYHLDRWFGLERQHQAFEPFFQCDIVCTADGGNQDRWAEIGVNHVWMPPGVVASEVGRGTPVHPDGRRDVGFVGSWKEYGHAEVWPWRFEMVSGVWNRYGSRFRAYPRGQALRGWPLNDVYASLRVVVGDSCLAGNAKRYWSDRVPETLGRGGFLLHPEVDGLDDLFPPSEDLSLVTYQHGDLDTLYAIIDYWASPARDERRFERVTKGIEWVREHHTYTSRMRDVVAMVEAWKAR